MTGWVRARGAYRRLEVRRAGDRARVLLPTQTAKVGSPASRTPRIASTAYVAAAGSPGPLLKNTPSGEAARMPAALVVAGTTSTSQPRAARWRGVDALMPRSTATTRYLAGPSGGTV